MKLNKNNIKINLNFFKKETIELVKKINKDKTNVDKITTKKDPIINVKLNFNFFNVKTLDIFKLRNKLEINSKEFEENEKNIDKDSMEFKVFMYQKNQDDEAFNFIYRSYIGKIEWLAKKNGDIDITGDLLESLWTAVKTYKYDKNTQFNTYFWRCVKNAAGVLNIKKFAKKRTLNNVAISLSKTLGENGESSMEDYIEDKDSSGSFDSSLFKMVLEKNIYPYINDIEKKTIEMLLNGFTLEEIGKSLGNISAPAIHMRLRRLLNKKNVGKQLMLLKEYC